MTKMHFEEAARIVREGMPFNTLEQRALVAAQYVQLFERFSTRFDRTRFYKACNVDVAA